MAARAAFLHVNTGRFIPLPLNFRKCNATHYPKIKNNSRYHLKSNTFNEQGAKKMTRGYSEKTDSGWSECDKHKFSLVKERGELLESR
jgi:hypothetical protein